MTKVLRHLWVWISLSTLVAIVVYGVWIEPNWLKVTIHHVDVPKDIDPIKIAQISDLHLKSIGSLEYQVIQKLKIDSPHAIVFSGDVIDDKNSIEVLEAFLSQMPNVKKVATLGNWEHWSEVDISRLMAVYLKNGVEILVNTCTSVTGTKKNVQLLGLDDYGTGQIDISSAIGRCETNAPVILVQHTPMFFDEEPYGLEKNIIFSMAGHTHGGQITLGGFAIFTPPGSGKYVRGWYETKWGRLHVSPGVGTSVIPMRLGSRPEVAIFYLK